MISWDTNQFLANEKLDQALGVRTVFSTSPIHQQINENLRNLVTCSYDVDVSRWITHGHLGEQSLWACIANLALEFGVSNDISSKIERGSKEIRFKHAVDFLSKETLNQSIPMKNLIDWLES